MDSSSKGHINLTLLTTILNHSITAILAIRTESPNLPYTYGVGITSIPTVPWIPNTTMIFSTLFIYK